MQNPHASKIVQAIEDPSVSGSDFRRLLQEFVGSLKDCLIKEANQSFATLAPLMGSRNLSRASLVSVVCGSMVESGCDPGVASPFLTQGISRALVATVPLVGKLEKKVRHRLEDAEDEAQQRNWIESGIRQLSVRLPQAAAGLKALERFMRPALTIYAVDPAGRQKALPTLWDHLSQMEFWIPEAAKLHRLLSVLENEPLVVIDVANHKGFLGRFGGAINNAQLIILLMDTFARQYVFPKALVTHEMGLCAKGDGPQQVGQTVHGAWNLYDHRALDSRLKLPDPKDLKSNRYWIWNERRPAEIPQVHGHRIILIGPPSYPREWEFEREFKYLKAGIQVDSELSRPDLATWLARINEQNVALRNDSFQPQTS